MKSKSKRRVFILSMLCFVLSMLLLTSSKAAPVAEAKKLGDYSGFITECNDYAKLVRASDLQASQVTGKGYAIAILDTGVDYNQPTLKDFVVNGGNFAYDPNMDNYIPGIGMPEPTPDTDVMDTDGHGTGNAFVLHAMAPEAKIIVLKICNKNSREGEGFGNPEGQAIQWILDNAAKYNIVAVNYSYSDQTEHPDDSFIANDPEISAQDADWKRLYDAGIFVASSAGNKGYLNGVHYPACSRYVIGVGSSDKNDAVQSFSNRGPDLDMLAPGSSTSVSAPVIAACAVLYRQYNDSKGVKKTIDETLAALQSTGKKIDKWSRIDIGAAVGLTATVATPAPGQEGLQLRASMSGQIVSSANIGETFSLEVKVQDVNTSSGGLHVGESADAYLSLASANANWELFLVSDALGNISFDAVPKKMLSSWSITAFDWLPVANIAVPNDPSIAGSYTFRGYLVPPGATLSQEKASTYPFSVTAPTN